MEKKEKRKEGKVRQTEGGKDSSTPHTHTHTHTIAERRTIPSLPNCYTTPLSSDECRTRSGSTKVAIWVLFQYPPLSFYMCRIECSSTYLSIRLSLQEHIQMICLKVGTEEQSRKNIANELNDHQHYPKACTYVSQMFFTQSGIWFLQRASANRFLC